MDRLVGTFTVPLPSRFLINRPEDEELHYKARFEEFDIELRFVDEREAWRSKAPDEKYFTFGALEVQISVAREEHIKPPPPGITPYGGTDWTVQSDYFDERLPTYQRVAVEIVNRAIRFFKYELRNPLLYELDASETYFHNPVWTDETGQRAGEAAQVMVAKAIPGLMPSLGAKRFTRNDDENFQKALEVGVTPELHEEILSDAQAAIFQRSWRRSVIELAIACEVVVKQAIFAKTSPAGAAFEYLEEKQQVEVTVVEIIHKVAERAYGKSFKTEKPKDFDNIEYLFRCRNKVAHRGELIYRDKEGKINTANRDIVIEWWNSVNELISWLKAVSP